MPRILDLLLTRKSQLLLNIILIILSQFFSTNSFAESGSNKNYDSCINGWVTCNMSALDQTQAVRVQEAYLRRNYDSCINGWVTCNKSALDQDQAVRVQEAYLRRNYDSCINGWVTCNHSVLSSSQQENVRREVPKRSDPGSTYLGVPCAENGSCYGDISALTGRPKTTHVNGYFRTDGTYVRGHYRSK